MKAVFGGGRGLALVVLVGTFGRGRAWASTEPALRAFDFVDSVGVCTHWGYGDTPYASFDDVRRFVRDSGIRHVRDGLHTRLHDLASDGITATVVVEPVVGQSMNDLVAALRAFNAQAPAAIDAVEGPNEPDLFWPNSHPEGYKGQPYPAGAVLFQKDLYAAVKSDPASQSWTVFGVALGTTLTPGNPNNPLGNTGELAPSVDWGNFHPYPTGNAFNLPQPYATIPKYYWDANFPSLPVEGWKDIVTPWIVYYRKPYGDKPMAATETGYCTKNGGMPERVVGKYLPRLFLEFFRKGIKRTFAYELLDEFDKPDDCESRFGMIRHDLSPKPSYTALKNLLHVATDDRATFDPGTIDIDVAVSPVTVKANTVRADGDTTDVVFDRVEYVRHVVLAKKNGARLVVLWHDIADADLSNGKVVELTPPAMPTTLTVATSFARANIISFDDDGNLAWSAATSARPLSLMVPDRPIVVELLPAGVPSVVADAPDAGNDAGDTVKPDRSADGGPMTSNADAALAPRADADGGREDASSARGSSDNVMSAAQSSALSGGCSCTFSRAAHGGVVRIGGVLALITLRARAARRRKRRASGLHDVQPPRC